ncbi:universal stress protein [Natronobacterium gregoryi]|uniref:Universal stress protein n=2 Tax=Natronobacterium gregoryi TaxID=44930 RepID=L0AEY6_NATGS|nr:universal stress protein [Natronobacterium gregoryi]AFZ71687.1 universal stress protein UspA-like protein [Natronobacterium gregoryi SP2]ELY72741.1 UspA domain-containing protein [Natronobacterium gregoryi SP2]PLK20265.1 universal stress protein [Natronobacterium gregoryi SP2]SFJ25169.1 Nucleotide-binding universal stress protein, UspA family [Natronobacterium gregoryi]
MQVLVPIDDSEPARKAVAHAATAYPDADLRLVHIINPSTSMYGDGAVYAYDSLIDARREAAARLFEETRKVAAEHGHDDVATETIVGRPAREIVSVATEENVDLVVIGSHGRSGASRVLLGSVAETVVRQAPVPVTVVR